MSNVNKFIECKKTKQNRKQTKSRIKKRGKKPKKMKEETVNNLASFVNQNVHSSNWKNFKQNTPNFGSASAKTAADKTRYREFYGNKSSTSAIPSKDKPKTSDSKEITKVISIDCEMVGIDTGKDSMLARVSLVNKFGNCIYDKYVLPSEPVVDYRTSVSGIRPKDLHQGEPFEVVQKEVAEIINGRILVGHAIRNDLKVLFLGHPKRSIRDTSRFKVFRKISNGGTPSLRKLSEELLNVRIQQGEHDSVIDARAAMQLYLLYRKEWEKTLHSRRKANSS